ncbi:MAG: hypothetical protein ABI360_09165 [Allobranchiibius sp.]
MADTTAASLLRVLLAGLVFGAGLPIVFAVGVRLLATGHGAETAGRTATRSNPVALAAAYALFAIVALVAFLGVLWITKGSLKHYLGIEIF